MELGLSPAERAFQSEVRRFFETEYPQAILAKTQEASPKLEGTVETAAAECNALGGKALALACDIRFEEQIEAAVARTVEAFGGIDICVNNASALSLSPIGETTTKRLELMLGVNTRWAADAASVRW